MNHRATTAVLLLFVFSTHVAAAKNPPDRFTGPWDVARLQATTPKAEWGKKAGLTQEVFYAGEKFGGQPTRVFGYYARPAEGEAPFPAMLLVHGGGGKAFAEWATLWAQRGYVALAMDLAGHGPDGQRLPDGGPDQSDEAKFRPFAENEASEMWTYHAVADVLLAHSLLASRPEVDARRIGVTGISWGGYLTCIIAGVDDRLKVAVPVYGCGFLDENSVWLPRFAGMPADQRKQWVNTFDPSKYLPGVSCPILFLNGTNDFAYPLDSYRKSYRAVPGRVDLSVQVRLPHGHPQGWAPPEIGLYVDSVLKQGQPLPRLGRLETKDGVASCTVDSKVEVAKAQLHYTADSGEWQKRDWQSIDASLADGRAAAQIPSARPIVYYLTVTDARGAIVSTDHAELVGEVLSTDGITLRYETRGQGGPALVFLHGWCCNRSFWQPQIRFFAESQQVVAIDLAGHGESGLGRKDWTMAAFGKDVVAVVRKLKLPRVVLVGHSMGGPVMLEAGALLKDELAGLIAVDAFTDPDEAYTYQQITDYCRPFQEDFPNAMRAALLHEEDFFRTGTDKQLRNRIVSVMTAAPPEMGRSAFLGMFDFANTRQRSLMATVKAPFVCINARRDDAKVADGRKYAPQFEVVALPESGHFLMMEHPDEFNSLLLSQLKTISAGK